jgi:hypothetical protein
MHLEGRVVQKSRQRSRRHSQHRRGQRRGTQEGVCASRDEALASYISRHISTGVGLVTFMRYPTRGRARGRRVPRTLDLILRALSFLRRLAQKETRGRTFCCRPLELVQSQRAHSSGRRFGQLYFVSESSSYSRRALKLSHTSHHVLLPLVAGLCPRLRYPYLLALDPFEDYLSARTVLALLSQQPDTYILDTAGRLFQA